MKNRNNPDAGWLPAQWPAPHGIHAGTTTRCEGTSRLPYDRFNLAMHVGDRPAHVDRNRRILRGNLQLPADPVWLAQTHSNHVISVSSDLQNPPADGACTGKTGIVCAVLTADCLPLLLCNHTGTQIAAIHVGWKGYCAGIIANAIRAFPPGELLMAWLGPCIRSDHYEVGGDVYAACVRYIDTAGEAFIQNRTDHWLADLARLVTLDLHRFGVNQIYDSKLCTYTDADRFFSHRRNGQTGRMASLIWMDTPSSAAHQKNQ